MTGYEVVSHRGAHAGRVITVCTDVVRGPTGEVVERDVIEHPCSSRVMRLPRRRRLPTQAGTAFGWVAVSFGVTAPVTEIRAQADQLAVFRLASVTN